MTIDSEDRTDQVSAEELLSAEEFPVGPESPALPVYADSDEATAGSAKRTRPDGQTRYSARQLKRAREVLARLYAVRRAARFYALNHPAVSQGIEHFASVAREYHEEGVDIRLAFFEGEIMLGEQLLTEESIMFDQLVRDMTSLGVGSIVIRRGVQPPELVQAFRILTMDAQALAAAGGLAGVVEAAGLEHVSIGQVQAVERLERKSAEGEEGAKAAYGGAVSLLREMDRLMRMNRHPSAAKIKGAVRSLVDNVVSNRYAMLQLTGLKNYDEYTFYHSANVAILSLALGSTITEDYRFLSSLGAGALLHDVGKLSVDLEVLNKPGALTPEEWAEVRRHPVRGAQIVSRLPGVDRSAVVMILEHHMRYDGSGYPQRTPARRQHLSSRIIAVADSFDAMTSRRSYSAARVPDEAMALLVKCAGSSLDPVLVRQFVRLLGVYPPRSVVRLSEGQIGVVTSPSTTDPLRPSVRVLASASGERISPFDVDLSRKPSLGITGCVDPRLLNIDVDSYFQ